MCLISITLNRFIRLVYTFIRINSLELSAKEIQKPRKVGHLRVASTKAVPYPMEDEIYQCCRWCELYRCFLTLTINVGKRRAIRSIIPQLVLTYRTAIVLPYRWLHWEQRASFPTDRMSTTDPMEVIRAIATSLVLWGWKWHDRLVPNLDCRE